MDKKTLMEKLAREAHEKGGFTGAWLYAEKGEIVSQGALGFRDPENTLPITEDTVFQLASVTKQFTAAAVMLLVRDGSLRLDDRLTKFFPELTAYGEVTIRHLLTHTAGVPDYFDDEEWFLRIWKEEHRVPRNDEIPRFLCETKLEPTFVPGEGIEYSNTGYNLLALIVERVSGVPFEDFLRENIFLPAGMTSARACHTRRDGIPFENYARALVYEDGRYVPDTKSAEYADVTAFDGLNGDDYVYTAIADMLRWDRVLRGGKVLTLKEQQLMYTPAKLNSGEKALYDDEEDLGYGFGWAVENSNRLGLIVSHSGGMPGVCTWFERFIDADRTLVYLISRDPEDYRVLVGFWKGMRKIARDEEPEPVRSVEELALLYPDRSNWESFCGEYETLCEDFRLEKVWMQDGELWGKASNEDRSGFTFRLYPLGENRFGRKGGMAEIEFGENCLVIDGVTCKKL